MGGSVLASLESNFWIIELLAILFGLLIFLIGIFGENKYNLVNKVKRSWAKIRNKTAQINFSTS